VEPRVWQPSGLVRIVFTCCAAVDLAVIVALVWAGVSRREALGETMGGVLISFAVLGYLAAFGWFTLRSTLIELVVDDHGLHIRNLTGPKRDVSWAQIARVHTRTRSNRDGMSIELTDGTTIRVDAMRPQAFARWVGKGVVVAHVADELEERARAFRGSASSA
jgi:hypothetical protein